jgi:hypothetical protein
LIDIWILFVLDIHPSFRPFENINITLKSQTPMDAYAYAVCSCTSAADGEIRRKQIGRELEWESNID